ncbi:MAG TPA: ester cyclase [Anaerolineae bacterium]|nr:ester cyclase [Anaerolineae bacterium]
MSREENKGIVRRYQDALNRNDLDALDEVVAADIRMPDILPGFPQGIEGAKQIQRLTVAGVPDWRVTIVDLIAEGDRVAARITMTGTQTGEFFGIPPSGRTFRITGIYIARIANGKIVEHRGVEDALGLMRQLGAMT